MNALITMAIDFGTIGIIAIVAVGLAFVSPTFFFAGRRFSRGSIKWRREEAKFECSNPAVTLFTRMLASRGRYSAVYAERHRPGDPNLGRNCGQVLAACRL